MSSSRPPLQRVRFGDDSVPPAVSSSRPPTKRVGFRDDSTPPPTVSSRRPPPPSRGIRFKEEEEDPTQKPRSQRARFGDETEPQVRYERVRFGDEPDSRVQFEEEPDPRPVQRAPVPTKCVIKVCQSGPCRNKGGEAVLAEIEELVKTIDVGDSCQVVRSGCLGHCSKAPNASIRRNGRNVRRRDGTSNRSIPMVHTRIRSLEQSAKVVEDATGIPPILNPEGGDGAWGRLAELRDSRAMEHARSLFLWNAALRGLPERAAKNPSLRGDLKSLLESAGFPGGEGLGQGVMPASIEGYSRWSIDGFSLLSKHTALFRLSSDDPKRGTPHPRGRSKLVNPITWHTTLLAEVGPNAEGPLPWVERDYTPISGAKDWEAGRCELLVKIYKQGAGTPWLLQRALGQNSGTSTTPTPSVWLSKPMKTLSVPGLVADGSAFSPASILLILAGTGAVALPQILHHRDPIKMLGISTPRRNQLRIPIDLVLSCREDDIPLLPQVTEWCREGASDIPSNGVRRCTLLLTPPADAAPVFPDAPDSGEAKEADRTLKDLGNVRVLRSRMDLAILKEAFDKMPQPCRIVVSGPGGFNSVARETLMQLVKDEKEITVLAA